MPGFFGFLLLLFLTGCIYLKLKKERNEEDKSYLSERKTFGSSRFLNSNELKNDLDLEFKPLNETQGIILGLLGNRVVSQSPSTRLNRNILSLGKAGSGKSTGFIIPYIYQSIKSGESLIVVDTKGDLYKQTSFYALTNGYQIKVLNCKDPEQSDSWNVFDHLSTHEDIWRVAEEIFECTSDLNESSKDTFWQDSAKVLLCTLIQYTISISEDRNAREKANLGVLYKILNNFPINEKAIDYLKYLFIAYADIHPTNSVIELFKTFYSTTNENVIGSFIQNLLLRLSRFQSPAIQEMLGRSTIDLVLPFSQKCIYYLNLDDQNPKANFAIRLFLRELLVNLINEADKYYRSEKIPITMVLDEFGAIGTLPEYDSFISTSRSRNIRNVLAFQNIDQIKKFYPNADSTIMGNCDIWQITGINELKDAEYISKMIGKCTVITRSESQESKELFGTENNKINISEAGRELLTPAEIRTLPRDKCIALVSNKSAIILDKIRSWEMPENNLGEKYSIYNYRTDRARFSLIQNINNIEINTKNNKNILGFKIKEI